MNNWHKRPVEPGGLLLIDEGSGTGLFNQMQTITQGRFVMNDCVIMAQKTVCTSVKCRIKAWLQLSKSIVEMKNRLFYIVMYVIDVC